MSDETRLVWLRVDFIFSREGVMEEIGVISLTEHTDSLEKVTNVKRVARVFRDLTPQLRDKRNHSLVHRPMCLNCHWLKFVGCRKFSSILQRLSFSSLLTLFYYYCSYYYYNSVAEWLACRTQAQKRLGSNRSRDAVG